MMDRCVGVVMVAAVAALLLLGACGKSNADAGATAKDPKAAQLAAANAMLGHAAKAATTFYMKNNKPPRSVQELVASRVLHIQKSADPWGQEFVLAPLEGGKSGVEICSSGPDMSPGTDDDVCKQVTF